MSRKRRTNDRAAPTPTPPPRELDEVKVVPIVCGALAVLIAIIYAQVGSHQFLTYDDPIYITMNDHVKHGLTLTSFKWALTSFDFNWHPLTWITLLIDISLFGEKAGPMLYGNVLLHIASTLILFFLLRRMTGSLWRSATVAALFGVHPLRVESVAWVAERKDVLCGLFFFLALFFYVRWTQESRKSLYAVSLLMFILGLMSKGMIVTLPFVMMLVDYWPLKRFDLKRGLIEKIPLFVLIIPGVMTTYLAQQKVHALARIDLVSPAARIANAVLSYVAYIGKFLWPSNLAIPYPLRVVIAPSGVVLAAIVLIAITAVIWTMRKRHRYLLAGWLWYVGMLVPVIGLVQIGSQSMADRYTYLPEVGLALAVVWLVADLVSQQTMLRAAALLVIAALAIASFMQVSYWKDSETLFRHSIAVSENNRVAHSSLGQILLQKKEYKEAADEFRAALAISSNDMVARTGLFAAAAALGKSGGITSVEEGIALTHDAVLANPQAAEAHNDYAVMLARGGRDQEALAEYREALRLDPHQYDAHMNLGALLARMNDDAGAAVQFNAAAQERPRSAEPHVYLALIHAGAGRKAEALAEIHTATTLDRTGAQQSLQSALHREITIEQFEGELSK